ncbi:MAG: hypothetical protein WCK65_00975 [Rhodospirillaceae bacterium]
MGRLILIALLALTLATAMVAPSSALASDKAKESGGNLIRLTIMVPVIRIGERKIDRIIPITIDVDADTPEAKNVLVNQMPRLQDAYIQATYGKIYTDWGPARILNVIKEATSLVAGDELKDKFTVSVRINVKPK